MSNCDFIGMERMEDNLKYSRYQVDFYKERLIKDSAIFGRAVKLRRKTKAWSQIVLAERMGISSSYLSDLETGGRNWTVRLANVALDVFKSNHKPF